MQITTIKPDESEFTEIEWLLKNEAPNQWNYLTDDIISQQFSLLRDGCALASVAKEKRIIAASIMLLKQHCPSSLGQYTSSENVAFIQDVVVHHAYSGKGLGSSLLLESIKQAQFQGCDIVFLERHEENLASAGMMRKAGFEEVETFYDPEKRSSGSRKTTVMKIDCKVSIP